MTSAVDRSVIEAWYRDFQDRFCAALVEIDGGANEFDVVAWDRPEGGGGDTRILAGDVLEKAAVNLSAVWGNSPEMIKARTGAETFYATGVSIICHPRNPHAPTFHANIRYFETDRGAWFGGGTDLTPCYLYEADARHFHATLRQTCDRHAVADYPVWKTACDDYFYLPHRGEARGIGGVFFDHLDDDLGQVWAFQQDLADTLMKAYEPILADRTATDYGDAERMWQEVRRGRYVEFNLIWDSGTRFGLESGGRTESILASMPPVCRWDHVIDPQPGSPERALLDLVRGSPLSWA